MKTVEVHVPHGIIEFSTRDHLRAIKKGKQFVASVAASESSPESKVSEEFVESKILCDVLAYHEQHRDCDITMQNFLFYLFNKHGIIAPGKIPTIVSFAQMKIILESMGITLQAQSVERVEELSLEIIDADNFITTIDFNLDYDAQARGSKLIEQLMQTTGSLKAKIKDGLLNSEERTIYAIACYLLNYTSQNDESSSKNSIIVDVSTFDKS